MQRQQEQPEDVKGRHEVILKAVNHHRIDIVVAERVRFKQIEPWVGYTNSEMRQMIDDKRQHDQAAHHHVPRCEVCLDVVPVDVCLWPGTAILNCQVDGHPDVNDDGSEQEQTNCPKQRAEVAQVLRVTIDPVGADKNLQIAKQMPDHKEDQNDARDRDNHFFPN